MNLQFKTQVPLWVKISQKESDYTPTSIKFPGDGCRYKDNLEVILSVFCKFYLTINKGNIQIPNCNLYFAILVCNNLL